MPEPKRLPVYCGLCGQPAVYVSAEAVDRGKLIAGYRGTAAPFVLSQVVSLTGLKCAGCENVTATREAVRTGSRPVPPAR